MKEDETTSRREAQSHLLVVTVGQGPVLLGGVEQQAQDEERQAELLVAGSLVCADEHAALKLRVCQHHDLKRGRTGGEERRTGRRRWSEKEMRGDRNKMLEAGATLVPKHSAVWHKLGSRLANGFC